MTQNALRLAPGSPAAGDDATANLGIAVRAEQLRAAFARAARRVAEDAAEDPRTYIDETLVPGGGE
jgi:hypothetical protein